MKYLKIITAFIFLFNIVSAQDSTKHFELGSTLITFNTHDNYAYNTSTINYTNGLFFRYTKKQLGVRALVSYSQNSYSHSDSPYMADGINESEHTQNFILGMGAQFSFLKKKDWLYTFLDLQYRNVSSTGFYSGGFAGYNNSFKISTNGLQTSLGLGFKIKIFKCVYLSPEAAYTMFCGEENRLTTNMYNEKTSNDNKAKTYMNFAAKLHLTVKF